MPITTYGDRDTISREGDVGFLDDKGDDGLHLIILDGRKHIGRVSNAISSNRSRKAKTRFIPRLTPRVFLLIA